jgi:hypothetical protein
MAQTPDPTPLEERRIPALVRAHREHVLHEDPHDPRPWVVKRSPGNGQPMIVTCAVETYVPLETCSAAKGR